MKVTGFLHCESPRFEIDRYTVNIIWNSASESYWYYYGNNKDVTELRVCQESGYLCEVNIINITPENITITDKVLDIGNTLSAFPRLEVLVPEEENYSRHFPVMPHIVKIIMFRNGLKIGFLPVDQYDYIHQYGNIETSKEFRLLAISIYTDPATTKELREWFINELHTK